MESIFAKNGFVENTFGFAGDENLKTICVDGAQKGSVQAYVDLFGFTCQVATWKIAPGGGLNALSINSRIDVDSDGCEDSDPYNPNMHFKLTGTQTFSFFNDASGLADVFLPVGS